MIGAHKEGGLGIDRDASLGLDRPDETIYNSRINRQGEGAEKEVTPAGLFGVASDAMDEMHAKHSVYSGETPGVMTAMVADKGKGDKIYLGSSQNNGDSVIHKTVQDEEGNDKLKYPETNRVVTEAEKKAIGKRPGLTEGADPKHGNNAKCGEQSCIAMWEKDNPGKKLNEADARFVTVQRKNGENEIIPPCKGKDGKGIGCEDVLKEGGADDVRGLQKPGPYHLGNDYTTSKMELGPKNGDEERERKAAAKAEYEAREQAKKDNKAAKAAARLAKIEAKKARKQAEGEASNNAE
ncbi:unnamed protein product [Clonostachys rosea]|uniref:Hypervirulence associated protein TUDOR domain-containing protein n=1 Tax=Bionectria ochroleuca TaxID=29856 RepID=A0ABY6U0Z9_BIOOC|nr:unnamed protein product [Clonostachys rosea]